MWRKPSGCSSYGMNFFNSFLKHALIEFFLYYIFLFDVYFSLYLFSNLAFCSFFLFLLLHSVLVTHHSAGSDLYSSINSIKNCYSSAVPFGRHSEINPITNNDSWHNHTVSTPSNTEVCLCKQALRRRKHWLLAQKISNCFDFTQAACASTQTTPYTVKQFAQTLFAQIACTCRGRFKKRARVGGDMGGIPR